MRAVYWLMLTGLSGCESEDDDGPGTPSDDDGSETPPPVTSSAAAYRWHDATGAQVTTGPQLVVFDDAGTLWGIDEEVGEAAALATFVQVFYAEPACAGPPIVALNGSQPAGYAITTSFLEGVFPDYVVRSPDLESSDTEFCYASTWSQGSCYETGLGGYGTCLGGSERWVAFSSLTEITPPDVHWVPPLHPEPPN